LCTPMWRCKNGSPANSYAANAGIVIGKDAVLAVDTLISAREAERFLADIRKVTDTTISVPTISFTQAARVDLGGITV